MEIFEFSHFGFTYAGQSRPALSDLSFSVEEGEFILLCGASGCGKTTLLRQMKPCLAPHGTRTGALRFCRNPISGLDFRAQTAEIGFVAQLPEEQAVTDKVWHELAFGLESLGLPAPVIRLRTAEMAGFFGIESWFSRSVASLSGGQKQLLNLASVMAMQPRVLLLDEPTSQLDPIAAANFLSAVKKVSDELGVAVVMVEQRLQNAFPLADRAVVLDGGRLIADGPPRETGALLLERKHPMAAALPGPLRIYAAVQGGADGPLTVREGRKWLGSFLKGKPSPPAAAERPVRAEPLPEPETAVRLKDCWFSYQKSGPDILRGLSLEIPAGELFCIVGGNGTGKTTALKLMAEIRRPYRGRVTVRGRVSLLPQNPQTLFLKSTVRADLAEIAAGCIPKEGRAEAEAELVRLTGLENLLDRHPYDLSGGEQQRAALAMVLLTRPDVLLLDEPTKGLDACFKAVFVKMIRRLTGSGTTVVMVSHDIEFCAEYADRCALLFDGAAAACGPAHAFFAGNSFYTTAANRMARGIFPGAVTNEDVISLCRTRAPRAPR